MYRNLLARVEISAPIEDRPLREMVWTILQVMLHDRRQAWDMQPDGSYIQRQPPASADPAAGPDMPRTGEGGTARHAPGADGPGAEAGVAAAPEH